MKPMSLFVDLYIRKLSQHGSDVLRSVWFCTNTASETRCDCGDGSQTYVALSEGSTALMPGMDALARLREQIPSSQARGIISPEPLQTSMPFWKLCTNQESRLASHQSHLQGFLRPVEVSAY